MKTRILPTAKPSTILLMTAIALTTFLLLTSTSCKVGNDGRPGLAYVAFEWEEVKPDYIDCGTSAVPPDFYYGTFYRISPGWYTAYYEGQVWNGQAWGSFAWEMDYEIWVNPGQRGGYGYNGRDGLNTYLTFVCNPFGPRLYRSESDLRKAPVERETDIRELVPLGEEIHLEYEFEDYTVKITARSVEPRNPDGSGNRAMN
jgi:hypothetical protein